MLYKHGKKEDVNLNKHYLSLPHSSLFSIKGFNESEQ